MCPFAFSKDSYRFDADQARDLADSLKDSSIKTIRLTGGEPLLLDEFVEICQIFKSVLSVRLSVITNGYFLPERFDDVLASEMDQVILSIDGASPASHDRFRRTPGLFERCRKSVELLKDHAEHIVVRVNTVVGKHNAGELALLYDTLCDWGVDQWSIIPLKREDGAWEGFTESKLRKTHQLLRMHVETRRSLVRILGFGLDWIGRDDEEIERYWRDLQPMTPRGRCNLVDNVRYYTPKDSRVAPCNCVPHRSNRVELSVLRTPLSMTADGLVHARDWLREYGPSSCRGCEPINVALGELVSELDADPWAY